jgi:hypothetical protein
MQKNKTTVTLMQNGALKIPPRFCHENKIPVNREFPADIHNGTEVRTFTGVLPSSMELPLPQSIRSEFKLEGSDTLTLTVLGQKIVLRCTRTVTIESGLGNVSKALTK